MSFYTGAHVSPLFMQRWHSRQHVGPAAPWCRVRIRRGRLNRAFHNDWPNPQFGRIVGQSIRHQWYATWGPDQALAPESFDYVELPGVAEVDLDQSFDKNGLTVATINVDNLRWTEQTGRTGLPFHRRDRGYLWPWRGYRPKNRPGSGDAPNEWWQMLPNAQILIEQGYGQDTAVRTFTGLIDSFPLQVRPDRLTITARDFGSILTDCNIFGWNKYKGITDPITFIPATHKFLKLAHNDGKTHRWIVVKDAVDVVKCVLRWAGFKEWEIEDSGVPLSTAFTVDKSQTYMDVINSVKAQLGYVFFIAEPTTDDLSIGVPVFRRSSVVVSQRSKPLVVRDQDLLTDLQPSHDNANDRYIIRVRGVVNKKIGVTLAGDHFKRVTFTYWPPWMPRMAGIIKQLTYYNIGTKGSVGFQTVQQCAVACILIAVQIGLTRDTATFQTPGQPALGLDSFAFITDKATGIASRVYITNRKSTMTIGGDGSSQQSSPYSSGAGSSGRLLWGSEIGGALCDNPEMDHVITDYVRATHGLPVLSWDSSND